MFKRPQSISFGIALGLHVVLGMLLFFSFEQTIHISMQAPPTEEPAEIIDAVMINSDAVQAEVARLEAIEAKQKAYEQAKERELQRKQKEAKEKILKEEKLAKELQAKNELLKKEAELERLAQIQQEKERQAKIQEKIKAEQAALKKLEKDKQDALLAKQKADEEKKAAELKRQKAAQLAEAKQKEMAEENARRAASAQMNQDQISHYARLIQRKVNQHWRQPLGLDFAGYKCGITVRLLPTGEVIEAMVIKSSGNVEFDRSAELAVRKASPLPIPQDNPELAKTFRQFNFNFNPGAV